MRNLVKALKGEPFNGYSYVIGVDGISRYINAGAMQAALDTFSVWGARRLSYLGVGQVTIVPVPSSSQVGFDQDTCPVRMTRAVAQQYPAGEVGLWLRFREPMAAAHAGGSRNQAVLEDALDVSENGLVQSRPVVLIDDVKTTGAHLRACANVLRKRGLTVESVLVAGSTVWDQHPTPLDVKPEDLEASPFDASGF